MDRNHEFGPHGHGFGGHHRPPSPPPPPGPYGHGFSHHRPPPPPGPPPATQEYDPRMGGFGCDRGFGPHGYGYGFGNGRGGPYGPVGGASYGPCPGFGDPRMFFAFGGPYGHHWRRRHWRHRRPPFVETSSGTSSSSSSSSSSESDDEKKDQKKKEKKCKKEKKHLKKKWHKLGRRGGKGGKGWRDSSGVTQCTLCWHQIRPLAETEVLECGHIYHRQCLKELFAISQTGVQSDVFCAQCRQQIDPDLAQELKNRFSGPSASDETHISAKDLTRDLKNLKVKE